MGSPFDQQQAAMEAALGAQMQQDIDAHVQAPGAPGGPHLQEQQPPLGMQIPAAMMQGMMQQFMLQFIQTMQQALPQVAQGVSPERQAAAPAATSPQGAGWQEDRHMANVRLDEMAFRRVEQFTDKREE